MFTRLGEPMQGLARKNLSKRPEALAKWAENGIEGFNPTIGSPPIGALHGVHDSICPLFRRSNGREVWRWSKSWGEGKFTSGVFASPENLNPNNHHASCFHSYPVFFLLRKSSPDTDIPKKWNRTFQEKRSEDGAELLATPVESGK